MPNAILRREWRLAWSADVEYQSARVPNRFYITSKHQIVMIQGAVTNRWLTAYVQADGDFDMDRNRNWLGWLGIGLGAVALLVALSGWFTPLFTRGFGSAPTPQVYAQQGNQSQSNMPQGGRFTPKTADQSGGARHGAGVERGGARPTDGGWGSGRWFGPASKLFDGLRNAALLVVLVLLGVVLLRRRNATGNRSTQTARNSGPEQGSPTGESYVDESGN